MEEEKKNQEERPNSQRDKAPALGAKSESEQSKNDVLSKSPLSPFIPKNDENANISDDVKRILKETKLPESRSTTEQITAPKIFDTNIGAMSDEKSANISDKDYETPPKKEEDPKIKSLRTFKDDLQGLIKVKKMSLVKAATLETEKTRGQKRMSGSDTTAQSKSRARIFSITFAVIVLVGLGILALFVVLAIQSQRVSDEPIVQDNSFLFSEQTFTLPIVEQDSRELLAQMAQARNTFGLTLGAITRIVPTIIEEDAAAEQLFEREATTEEFFSALNVQTQNDFLRSFDNFFFLGIHTIDENVPIIILPVVLYQNAFADMLKWEQNMNDDLSPLFTKVPYQTRNADGNITINEFEDVIIRNYDVRALRDLSGDIRMLYAFPTKEILIIAESPHSFVEALARLRAERRL